MLDTLKKFFHVVYWLHYSNYLRNPKNGSHFNGALLFTVVGAGFVFGIFNYLAVFGVEFIINNGFIIFALGGGAGLYVWLKWCLKDEGYQEERDYFNSIPENKRWKVGFWLNFYFFFWGSFPFISSLFLGIVVKLFF